jgi:hypothetical protein
LDFEKEIEYLLHITYYTANFTLKLYSSTLGCGVVELYLFEYDTKAYIVTEFNCRLGLQISGI